jgi:hypothetical protein
MAWYDRRSDRHGRGLSMDDPNDPKPPETNVPFTNDVATALNIFRHEEIERFRTGQPWTDDDWANGAARKVADGELDRKKQTAFYVDISKTGEVGLHPDLVSREDAADALKRAERFIEGPARFSDEYRKLQEVLPLVFSNLMTGVDD